MNIRFNIIGVCTQEIELVKDCPLTEKEIMDALNGSGEHAIATTVQENGDLVMYKDGQEIILGKVVSSDVDGEYEDFADPAKEWLDDEDLDEEDDNG